VVYALDGQISESHAAPAFSLAAQPRPESRGRMHVSASVDGSSFYEVTFYAKVGNGAWQPIGTDDSAPYQVFHDTSGLPSGTPVQYRAVVADNAHHTATSNTRATTVPAPALTIEAPAEGSGARGTVEVRAVPTRTSHHVVTFERKRHGAAWTTVGMDSTSPAYTVFDDLTGLNLPPARTPISYRAKLLEPNGTNVTSATRTIHAAGPPAPRPPCTTSAQPVTTPTGAWPHVGRRGRPSGPGQIAWDHPLAVNRG